MRDAHLIGDIARIMDVLARAAGALLLDGGAVIIELQRDPDHVIALIGQHGGDDRAVDPARHGGHDTGFRWGLCKAKRIELARWGAHKVSHLILQRVQGPQQKQSL